MLTAFVIMGLIIVFFVMLFLTKKNDIARFFFKSFEESSFQLQNQFEEITDQILQRLEYKIEQLEAALQEADDKIKKLEAFTGDERKEVSNNASIQENIQAGKTQINFVSMGQGISQYQKNNAKNLTKKLEAPIIESSSFLSDKTDNKREMVQTMINQGYSETEIARATGLGLGEVQLVLQLNKVK